MNTFKITANTYENTSVSVEFDINTLFNNGFENSMCDPITNLLGVSVDNIVLRYESPIHLKMKKCRKHIELFNIENSLERKVIEVRIAIQEILLEFCNFYRLYPTDMEGKDYTGQTFTFYCFGDIHKNVLFEDFDEDFHFCYEIIK